VLKLPGMRLAEITPEILIDATELPGAAPADPADRIIAATARHHGLVLVSRDRQVLNYGDQGNLRTLAC
jgi:PIN domain nuclease of toxin-antitoxin system